VNAVSEAVDEDAGDRSPSALKRLLQGRPLGHPLHPMLVHLPIGLWVLGFVVDVIGLSRSSTDRDAHAVVRSAFYMVVVGLFFAALAAVTGFADYFDVRKDHLGRKTATLHMLLNLVAFVVFAISAALHLHATRVTVVATILSGVGVVLVGISGYLGGVLVYDDGVAVGRHRSNLSPQTQTLTVSAPPDDGWVDVMDSDDLSDGVPLRAEVNGHIMVLLRPKAGGDVTAFQEFCTHRCGPLSEGTVDDGQITCPWHRSRFDVHTGKPTHGPAKVDLKIYPVREERGRIHVSVGTS
jgi:nitrite reductase/ring-hydroxylating ferredoxin subunit/uncharacterized membrane protein